FLFMAVIGSLCLCSYFFIFFFFFFSSRRRHTRWPRDWSSDVCSSDLDINRFYVRSSQNVMVPLGTLVSLKQVIGPDTIFHYNRRSEERRVGKECRSRWSADH